MKKNKPLNKQFYVRLLMVGVMLLASLALFSKLPETVPTHWNLSGEVDGYGSKWTGLFLVPGMALLFTLLFPILRKIDPRRKNYEKFKTAWEMIQTVIIAFFAYFHLALLYLTLNPEKSDLMPSFMFVGISIMFVLLGFYMMKVRQNYFVGLKTPWTLDDPEVWDKSHQFTGKIFIAAGLIMFLEAWLRVYLFPVLMGIIIVAVILPILYSYLVWRKRH
jgi:uncharacterized membrane protein